MLHEEKVNLTADEQSWHLKQTETLGFYTYKLSGELVKQLQMLKKTKTSSLGNNMLKR